ncbi:hypothetical protein [Streptomyces sp. SPB4]|uniref:mycothiol-dependent nitroreductase Rv2466c family protein n=1 Tax=Streptomyces sp. SPB4 TaxID=2940553 RepID=UPI002476B716|nr:hypothetical protein [Streptomyces sp. SPB4]MDH6542267.1 putative DsbA family dithiol-disulfide isomerase [Streptomyces sp. SPB4]
MTSTVPGPDEADRVDLWVDPLCAWTWITYQWLRQAGSTRPLTLSVRPTGLGYLEGAPGRDQEDPDFLERAPGPVRVLAAAEAGHGPEAVAALYEAIARRFHGAGGIYDDLYARTRGLTQEAKRRLQVTLLEQAADAVAAALEETGLPRALIEAMSSTAWDGALRAAHESIPRDGRALDVIGVPVVSVNGGPGVFGPVLRAVPAGQRAGRLWDGFRALAQEEAFLEMRRVTPRPAPKPELLG